MKSIPSVVVPIIIEEQIQNSNLFDTLKDKKIIIFGVPGAFTPTCSEKHLPGFYKNYNSFKLKGIEDIFCLSVNDPYVMKSWLSSYNQENTIKGIADGNAEIANLLNVTSDKSSNYMGVRCDRFAMVVKNNIIDEIYIEKPGTLDVSSAENILTKL